MYFGVTYEKVRWLKGGCTANHENLLMKIKNKYSNITDKNNVLKWNALFIQFRSKYEVFIKETHRNGNYCLVNKVFTCVLFSSTFTPPLPLTPVGTVPQKNTSFKMKLLITSCLNIYLQKICHRLLKESTFNKIR